MAWWIWVLIGVYLLGVVIILYFHMTELQMVTFPLALLRALGWPIWIFIGWPRGTPLPMD